eukprot:TRINITY_DN3817_c0_g1_i3.p1 TRINITY_DN3817_c0_g1~~TRINITY_DN3817_c0_g1_i3.p1  ORF type:complete len:729 (+),score=147.15 TRINITY_DN3817_c0_g1_i3:153-2339(+)
MPPARSSAWWPQTSLSSTARLRASSLWECALRSRQLVSPRVEIISTGVCGVVTGTSRGRVGVQLDTGETVGVVASDVAHDEGELEGGFSEYEVCGPSAFPVGCAVKVAPTGVVGKVAGTARGRVGVDTGHGIIGVPAEDVVRLGAAPRRPAMFPVGAKVRIRSTGVRGVVTGSARGRIGVQTADGVVGVIAEDVLVEVSDAAFAAGGTMTMNSLATGGGGEVASASKGWVRVRTKRGVVTVMAALLGKGEGFSPAPPGGDAGAAAPRRPKSQDADVLEDSVGPWGSSNDSPEGPGPSLPAKKKRRSRTRSDRTSVNTESTEKSDVTEPGRRRKKRSTQSRGVGSEGVETPRAKGHEGPPGLYARQKAKREREMEMMVECMGKRYQEAYYERQARLKDLEVMERKRLAERHAERESARKARGQTLREPSTGVGKQLERRILDKYDKQVQRIAREEQQIILQRRAVFDELSTKNPEWQMRLDQHDHDVRAAQRRHREEHQKEMKTALRTQQQNTPSFAYSPALELARKEQAEREAEEAAKLDQPFINHMRKMKYGALVNDLYGRNKREKEGRVEAATPLPPIHAVPVRPAKAREERHKVGTEYMRQGNRQMTRRPSHDPPRQPRPPPPPNQAMINQGNAYMREAGAIARAARDQTVERSPSPTQCRRDLISLSKRHVGASDGWEDDTLQDLAKGVISPGRTAAALGTLHAHSDALVEALNLKLRILESLD